MDHFFVISGPVPAIHVLHRGVSVDARIMSGHDDMLAAGSLGLL